MRHCLTHVGFATKRTPRRMRTRKGKGAVVVVGRADYCTLATLVFRLGTVTVCRQCLPRGHYYKNKLSRVLFKWQSRAMNMPGRWELARSRSVISCAYHLCGLRVDRVLGYTEGILG